VAYFLKQVMIAVPMFIAIATFRYTSLKFFVSSTGCEVLNTHKTELTYLVKEPLQGWRVHLPR
jgi:hypothetical protein